MKVRGVAVLAVCILALLAVSAVPAQAEEIMYLTSWQGSPSQINWNVIDYVMYAFSIPSANGSSAVPGGLSGACSAAHGAGKKCLLSYGGWNNGDDSAFEAIAASSAGRTTFANSCASAIAAGADGCDLDWEYPEQEDSANYSLLVDAIRARIGSGKLITAAVANHGYNARASQDACKSAKLDFAMIMSYDGGDGALHSPISYAQTAISDWQSYGVPMSRVFLGVPFYGRPTWAGYNTLRAAGCSSTSDTCTYQGSLVYYNGVPTIQQKRSMITNAGGRGLMAWEVSFDYNSELQNAMNGGGGNPTPTTPPNATPTRTPTTVGATPTTGGSGCWAAWSATATYTTGMQVSRTCSGVNENFEAAFWTNGNDPCTSRNIGGNGQPWYPKGTCGGAATATRTPTATATTGATATRTPTGVAPTATRTSTATATPTTGAGKCAGVAAFANCTVYANGAKAVFNNTLYHTIAAIPNTRDCPPNSPYNPSTDNWWVNDGGC